MTDKVTITRDDLYKLVWEEPLGKIAKRYGISPSEITEACNKLDIPKPEQGHWTKIDLGHEIPKPSLPEQFYEDQQCWTFGLKNQTPIIRKPRAPRLKKVIKARLKDHPILKDIRQHLLASRYLTEHGYLKPNKKIIADIFVSKDCADKAVQFANSLFCSLDHQGYPIYYSEYENRLFWRANVEILEEEPKRKTHQNRHFWSPLRSTLVNVDGVEFGISIYEMSHEIVMRYADGKYFKESEFDEKLQKKYRYHHTWTTTKEYPTGRLCLQIYSLDGWLKQWREEGSLFLEAKIPEIIKTLKDSVSELTETKERLRIEKETREREWEEEKRLREIAREKAFIRDARISSKNQLEEIIKNWDEAVQKHKFFKLAEETINTKVEPERTYLLNRIVLARELIGTIDPIEYIAKWQTPDEILPILKKKRDIDFLEDDENWDLLDELED